MAGEMGQRYSNNERMDCCGHELEKMANRRLLLHTFGGHQYIVATEEFIDKNKGSAN